MSGGCNMYDYRHEGIKMNGLFEGEKQELC